MTNCYNLAIELMRVLMDIDKNLDLAGKATSLSEKERYFTEIDRLESKMYDIKAVLKSIEV